MSELYEVLGQLAIFESLDGEELEVLASVSAERTFAAGERLYSEGDTPSGLSSGSSGPCGPARSSGSCR